MSLRTSRWLLLQKEHLSPSDRDYIMTAAQSQEYGIIDEVIDKRA